MTDAFSVVAGMLLKIEGGFVDDPDDSGGATNWGITEALAREYGYTGRMADMTRDDALGIYRRAFWEPINGTALYAVSAPIAGEVFDTAVNCGRVAAVRMLQRCLNALNDGATLYDDIAVDGRLGNRTIEALGRCLHARGADGVTVILRGQNALQGSHYIELAEARPKDERFLYGWLLNRVDMPCGH